MHCTCETQRDGQAELLTVSVVAVSVSVRTAYALYMRDTMQKSRGSDSNSREHLRECAQGWSKLSPEDKQHYKDLLSRDMQQYLADVDQFKKVLILHGVSD